MPLQTVQSSMQFRLNDVNLVSIYYIAIVRDSINARLAQWFHAINPHFSGWVFDSSCRRRILIGSCARLAADTSAFADTSVQGWVTLADVSPALTTY